MSKKKKKKKNTTAKHAASDSQVSLKNNYNSTVDIAIAEDILAAAPGFLMCLLIAAILVCDMLLPGMDKTQYDLFQQVFRIIDPVIAVTGAIYLFRGIYTKRINAECIKSRPAVLFFAAFAALIIVSTCVNGFSKEAVHGIPYRDIGVFTMLSFILMYMGVSSNIYRDSLKNVILVGYMAVADAVGLAVLYDRYASYIAAFHEKKELSAVFFNGNHYGYFLVMAVLISIGWFIYGKSRRVRLAGAISAALNAVLLVINHSMGCIVAVIVVFAIMAVDVLICEKDKRKRLAVLVIAAVGGLTASLILSTDLRDEFIELTSDAAAVLSGSVSGSAGHNRMMLWETTWKFVKHRPLLGYGCEGISTRLFAATERSNPHNEILTYAAYYGTPAAACYLLGVIAVFIGCFRRKKTLSAAARLACMAAAGYFISSITGVAMFYTAPFFFIFLGMTAEG